MICRNCGQNNPDNEEKCHSCGADMNEDENNNTEYSGQCRINKTYFTMPMKWFGFLVTILLPINIFSNIIDGLQLMIDPSVSTIDVSGLGDVSRTALEKLNFFMGMCMLIIAVFMIYTLRTLRGFRKNSLLCIQTIYVSDAVVNCVNGALMYAILGAQAKLVVYYMFFANIFSAIFMIIVNTVYFKKRKHIFIH